MRNSLRKIVPLILVLSMIFTTGVQGMNMVDNTKIEDAKQNTEVTPLIEEVKEEIAEELGVPSISLDISTDKKTYKNGDTIFYKIKLINDGEVDLQDIKISEELNKEHILKELKVEEEKVFEREFKIKDQNTFKEIENKIEVKANFNDKDLKYKEEFKVAIIKEEAPKEEVPKEEEPKEKEPKEEEPKEEAPKEEAPKEEEPKEEEAKEEEPKEEELINDDFESELDPNRPIGKEGPKIVLPSSFYNVMNKMSTQSFTDTIAVDKTAERSPGCRTFEVTLKITGTPQEAPVDVVLVIDRSGSMGFAAGNGTRLDYAKQAAINFAGRVLGPNGVPGSRVAVVSYSGPTSTTGYGNQNQASTDSIVYGTTKGLTSNLTSVTSAINGLNANGGTNTEAGFIQGKSEITNSISNQNPNSNKVVIMFTDGLPTASNGNQYNESTDINTTHNQRAITSGQSIHSVADVFTIGLVTGMNTTEKNLAFNILTAAANKTYYPAPSATDLDAIFNEISQSLGYAATNAKVVDKIGDNFDLVLSSLPSGASYNAATREISWNPGTIVNSAELKYNVVAKPGFAGGLADTNKFATLTYKDIFGTVGNTKTFPIPKVNVPTLIEIALTDATITIGDSIDLGIGADPAGENYMSPVTGGDNDGTTFTYEWRKVGNSTVISTNKNPSVSPTQDTEYEVKVTDSNGCIAVATMIVKVTTPKRDIEVNKVWVGGADRPDVTIHLFAGQTEVDSVKLVSPNLTHTFTQLPVYDVNGDPIVYTITEDDVVGYSKV